MIDGVVLARLVGKHHHSGGLSFDVLAVSISGTGIGQEVTFPINLIHAIFRILVRGFAFVCVKVLRLLGFALFGIFGSGFLLVAFSYLAAVGGIHATHIGLPAAGGRKTVKPFYRKSQYVAGERADQYGIALACLIKIFFVMKWRKKFLSNKRRFVDGKRESLSLFDKDFFCNEMEKKIFIKQAAVRRWQKGEP